VEHVEEVEEEEEPRIEEVSDEGDKEGNDTDNEKVIPWSTILQET
jgi:hypothetical protein